MRRLIIVENPGDEVRYFGNLLSQTSTKFMWEVVFLSAHGGYHPELIEKAKNELGYHRSHVWNFHEFDDILEAFRANLSGAWNKIYLGPFLEHDNPHGFNHDVLAACYTLWPSQIFSIFNVGGFQSKEIIPATKYSEKVLLLRNIYSDTNFPPPVESFAEISAADLKSYYALLINPPHFSKTKYGSDAVSYFTKKLESSVKDPTNILILGDPFFSNWLRSSYPASEIQYEFNQFEKFELCVISNPKFIHPDLRSRFLFVYFHALQTPKVHPDSLLFRHGGWKFLWSHPYPDHYEVVAVNGVGLNQYLYHPKREVFLYERISGEFL